jgi:hypothetical protein
MARYTTRLRDGRQDALVRGTRTQTANVCTPDDRAGDYEHVYRLPIGGHVEPADLAELADAAALRNRVVSRNGVAEQRDGRGGRAVLALVEVEEDRYWLVGDDSLGGPAELPWPTQRRDGPAITGPVTDGDSDQDPMLRDPNSRTSRSRS